MLYQMLLCLTIRCQCGQMQMQHKCIIMLKQLVVKLGNVDLSVIERGNACRVSYARSARWCNWGHGEQSGFWSRFVEESDHKQSWNYCYRWSSMICLSIGRSVGLSQSWALQKYLNRLRCHLDVDSGGPRNHVLDGGPDPPMWRGTFEEENVIRMAVGWLKEQDKQFFYNPPFPQIDVIAAMVIVWRVRGKMIRSVLCNIAHNNYAQCNAHTWTDLTVLWSGFCLTGPISLCLDSFLYMYYCMHV